MIVGSVPLPMKSVPTKSTYLALLKEDDLSYGCNCEASNGEPPTLLLSILSDAESSCEQPCTVPDQYRHEIGV